MFKSFKLSPIAKQYCFAFIANIHLLNVGLGIAWTSPVLVKLTSQQNPVLSSPLNINEASWVGSIGIIAALFSLILASFLANSIGRRNCFLIQTVPRILTYLILTFASKLWMLLLGRALCGLADGLILMIAPLYASEIASKEIRGSTGTMINVLCCTGSLIMLCIGPYLSYFTINLIVLCICVVTSLPLVVLPDTPYSLYNRGKKQLCFKELTRLRGSANLAVIEMKEFDLQKSAEGQTSPLNDIVKEPAFIKACFIVFTLGVCVPLTGAQAIFFYLQTILESTDTSISSNLGSLILGIVQFVGSAGLTVFIDKFPRKAILTISLCGMAIGSAGLATFFMLHSSENLQSTLFINLLPLISLVIYLLSYNAGLGSLHGPLSAELFNGKARSFGVWVSQFTTVSLTFITTKFLSNVTEALGPIATYFSFSFICVLTITFIWIFLPETKGKTFLEIEKSLR